MMDMLVVLHSTQLEVMMEEEHIILMEQMIILQMVISQLHYLSILMGVGLSSIIIIDNL